MLFLNFELEPHQNKCRVYLKYTELHLKFILQETTPKGD